MNASHFLWATLCAGTICIAQDPDFRTVNPHCYIDAQAETATPLGTSASTATGLQETRGATSWYSRTTPSHPLQDNVLIVGESQPGVGCIRHLRRKAGTQDPYSLISTLFLPGQRPDGVAFDSVDESLYCIDNLSRITWRATWDGTTPLSGLMLSAWYDASGDIPALSTATASLKLLPFGDLAFGLEPRTTAATKLRISPRVSIAAEVYGTPAFALVDVATAQSTPITPTVISGDQFMLNQRSFREGATSVHLHCGQGHSHTYILSRLDTGATLGTATQLPVDTSVTIPAATALEAGVVYGVHRASSPGEIHRQRCMVRFGTPGSTSSTPDLELGELQFSGPFSAGQPLQLSCPVSANVPTPILIATTITLAGPGSAGTYPLVQLGPDQFVIDTTQNLPVSLRTVSGDVASWLVYQPIDVPSTPGIVGQVFLTQAVAVDSNSVIYFTDILGGAVLP
ncbi:MAG: hypothetical protein ACE37K_20695 [Planctomycetota bacterium]